MSTVIKACLLIVLAVVVTLAGVESSRQPAKDAVTSDSVIGTPAGLIHEIPAELQPVNEGALACDPSSCFISCVNRGWCEGECTASGTCRCFLRPNGAGQCP
jgi:hypothetical protein